MDIVQAILSSSTSAAVSTCIVIFLCIVYWYYVMPQLADKARLEEENKELTAKYEAQLLAMRDYAVTSAAVEKLDEVLRNVAALTRQHEHDTEKLVELLNDLSKLIESTTDDDSENARLIASSVQEISGQIQGITQRIWGMSGAIYALTGSGNPDGFGGDLRAPK